MSAPPGPRDTRVGFTLLSPATYRPGMLLPVQTNPDGHQTVDGLDLCVTTTPRAVWPAVVCGSGIGLGFMTLQDLLEQGDCLARLTPLGPVRPHPRSDDASARVVSDSGWRITGFDPIDAVLGPQAAQLRVAAADLAIIHDDQSSDLANTYSDAVNSQYRSLDWAPQPYCEAAQQSLERVGADGWWWAHRAGTCVAGTELVAIAARDLIGTVPGWTRDGYGELVYPYRAAFGRWPHPDDHDTDTTEVTVR